MAYVIGIDTGGTYTDAVLLDAKRKPPQIIKKAKAFTTHDQLEIGIRESVFRLRLGGADIPLIDKVVLSTTLATNAIVEGNLHKVGVIIVGDMPKGKIASEYVRQVPGKINIKGRMLVNVNKEETLRALEDLRPRVQAIAVSGASSVRNPMLEQEVRDIVRGACDLPVMCGHEFVSELGYLERTNTVAINAGLLPIINRFLEAIKNVLRDFNILAPIFVVKGNGSIATERSISERPIETALSGPAASMIGAINLTGIKDAVVSDMGGTTTDTGIVQNQRVALSKDGAKIGDWRLKIKSAKLYTSGLGGDSQIRDDNGDFHIGPKRVLPACRGGPDITPTDLTHVSGEFDQWDTELAKAAVARAAGNRFLSVEEYAKHAENAVVKKILDESIGPYKGYDLPICAIGAPAGSWYAKVRDQYDFELIIPEHYDVANAVGAATAGIQESAEAIVRPGEEGRGYLVHTEKGRFFIMDRLEAVRKAVMISIEHAQAAIINQNLEVDQTEISCTDAYMEQGRLKRREFRIYALSDLKEIKDYEAYVETRIKVSANGKNFI